jgi:hypothetical protein
MRLTGQQIDQQRRRIGEIEHPRPAGGEADQYPDDPFRHPQPQLARAPILAVEAQASVAVALDPALDQDEEVGPDGLRAGIAAPDPAQRRGKQEQPQPRHDQKARDKVELVRPDLDPEEEEAAVRHIHQHRLIGQAGAAVPADPGGDVIEPQGHCHDHPFEAAKAAPHPAREDRRPRGVKGFWAGVWRAQVAASGKITNSCGRVIGQPQGPRLDLRQ